jgi:quinolinate synthase
VELAEISVTKFAQPNLLNASNNATFAGAVSAATESGIIHQMLKQSPEKIFHPVPNAAHCNCAECPFMRLNTLEKIRDALLHLEPQIHIPEDTRRLAVQPLERMLAL